jgi:hypothetical protein
MSRSCDRQPGHDSIGHGNRSMRIRAVIAAVAAVEFHERTVHGV